MCEDEEMKRVPGLSEANQLETCRGRVRAQISPKPAEGPRQHRRCVNKNGRTKFLVLFLGAWPINHTFIAEQVMHC